MDASSFKIKLVLLPLLCTTMFNSFVCSLKVQCNKKDMDTLLHFKQGAIDTSGFLSSWSIDQDCCHWTGVQCDNITGRVIELNLPCHTNQSSIDFHEENDDESHCLRGKFDLSLLDLEFLSYLNLSNNDFKAIQYNSVSDHKCIDMSKFTLHKCRNSSNLQYLDMSYNYDIFIENLNWLSHLSSLKYLNLNGIDLHKAVDWLQPVTMLPSLLELHLQSCQLENIYSSLQYVNFTSLKVLDIGYNHFVSQFPSWLFNLSCGISHIDLSQNQIHGQMSKITSPNLGNIQSLKLSHNALSGLIPNWLGQLEQLHELDLSHNTFSGSIPMNLGNLSSLLELVLESNYLSGNLPESLGLLSELEHLRVGDNSLSGIVSERNLISLSNLKHLSLRSPALTFYFDPKWVPPFQLEFLRLGYYVGDKLPSWLLNQSSLKILAMAHSSASFEPLDKFWNFVSQLDFISLTNNTINADMSYVLLDSKYAWLNSNHLRGGLPQISQKVVVLELGLNLLSGSISRLLCHNMTEKNNLLFLDLSYNLLSGELTDCWNAWKSLRLLNVGNNNLTGKIPHSMSSLSNLLSLNLNDNKFFGDVPLSLKNCQKLQALNLGNNNFFGTIPSWIGHSVKALQLRSNQFSGNIPTQICQLNSLKVMDFAKNRLWGPMPNCLHNITAMLSNYASTDYPSFTAQIGGLSVGFSFTLTLVTKGSELPYSNLVYMIDFSSNNLSQSVPLEIFMLTNLQSLNLSHNQLEGMIPKEIGNLKQLESIDLSTNWLSGEIPESMSSLSFLAFLNLSFNNFMGKIPLGTQLQSFTNLSYIGNPQLCGTPLTTICPQDEESNNTKPVVEDDDDDDKSEVYSWFYMGLGIGFAVGFWGVLGAILFNRRCRHAYFTLLHRLYDTVIW